MLEVVKSALIAVGAAAVGWTEGVICVTFPYLPLVSYGGNLSVYARGQDYHIWARAALEQGCQQLAQHFPDRWFTPFCDNSPFDEVGVAVACGLGALGRNGLLITEKYGSYVFIGTVKTDLPLPKNTHHAACLNCGKCQKACPTGAIGHHGVAGLQCLSHLTQKRGQLSEAQGLYIKNHSLIWGCDTCQSVCPMNEQVEKSNREERIAALTLADLEGLSDRNFRKKYHNFAFAFRGLQPLVRNLQLQKPV